jgi:transmembrane sensor
MTSALDDEAITWLVRVQSDAATAEDWAALTAWLETSSAHVEAFARAEQLCGEISDNADEIAAATRHRTADVLPFRSSRPPSRRWLPFAGLGAAAAAVVVGAAPVLQRAYEGAPTVYRTGVGEARDIALADGTRVHLDAASTMTVRLGWRRKRSVELAQAQASFDVARDPSRPFVVDVGDQRIRVVGTEFNVRRFNGTVVVTVRRGVVEVNQPNLASSTVAHLTSGEELSHAEGSTASRERRVDADTAFAWRAGRLVCEDESLAQIVADLNRRYTLPIRVTQAAGAKRFSGVLDVGDQGVLVRRLADYLSLSVQRTDRDITLS